MKNCTQILPGIRAIGWIDCRMLSPNAALYKIVGQPFPVTTDIHPIDFFDEPDCTCSSEKVNGQRVYTANLSFLCATELHDIPIGFVVTDVEGRSFLIGGKEQPWPKCNPTKRTGQTAGDAAGVLYEIEHKSIGTLIPCVVSYGPE